MSQLIQNHAENSPDREGQFLSPEIFPSFRALYHIFAAWHYELHLRHCDEDVTDTPPCSEDHFVKQVRKLYPALRIPKTNKFAQCDICFKLAQKRDLADTTVGKAHWTSLLNKHRDDIRKDKEVYYKNRSDQH